MGLLRILLLPIIGFAFYMLPTIVAILRKKESLLAIGLVNFFLGWSVIGWFATLIWAFTNDPPRAVYHTPVDVYIPNAGGFCPSCGKFNHANGRFCPECGAAMARETVRAAEIQGR